MLDNKTWNHLTLCKEIISGLFKNNASYKLFTYKSCMYEHDLALNNL